MWGQRPSQAPVQCVSQNADQDWGPEQVHNLLAFRIFTNSLGECYTALGLIHADFRHIPERLKDYIANPKSNGYQSLHTVVIGPKGQQIEIQIRTHEMHHVAEVGLPLTGATREGRLSRGGCKQGRQA